MTPEEREFAVDRLIEMGYLKYVPSSERPALRERMIDSLTIGHIDTGWGDTSSNDRRVYDSDNEELAEGAIGQSILKMKETLQAEGVQLDEVEDVMGDSSYHIIANGKYYLIYNLAINGESDTWGLSLKRYLEIVNDLLQSSNSKERLYGIYGGNDGLAILLTDEMYNFLQSPKVTLHKRWMPYPPSAVDADGRMIE